MSKPAYVLRIRSTSTITAAISASKAIRLWKVRDPASFVELEESSTHPRKHVTALRIKLTSGTMFHALSAHTLNFMTS